MYNHALEIDERNFPLFKMPTLALFYFTCYWVSLYTKVQKLTVVIMNSNHHRVGQLACSQFGLVRYSQMLNLKFSN